MTVDPECLSLLMTVSTPQDCDTISLAPEALLKWFSISNRRVGTFIVTKMGKSRMHFQGLERFASSHYTPTMILGSGASRAFQGSRKDCSPGRGLPSEENNTLTQESRTTDLSPLVFLFVKLQGDSRGPHFLIYYYNHALNIYSGTFSRLPAIRKMKQIPLSQMETSRQRS